MGLFDKAVGNFNKRGEETVRQIDYDLPEEEVVPAPKSPKVPRAPRPKLGDLLPARDKRKDYLVESDTPAFALEELEESPIPPLSSSWEKGVPPIAHKPQESVVSSAEGIKDVLDVLKIPGTFVIPSDVLMPEDFPTIQFDVQFPKGYDIGQVEFFVERSESSIATYVRMLEERNEHVAKLATTGDRLQVDLQNLKYDSQIAAGIGIMPTSDNDELERDNIELKLQVARLRDELKNKSSAPDLSSRERELYEELRNRYSILQRERDDLEQTNLDLKTQLAHLDEEKDDPEWMNGETTAGALPSFSFGDDESEKPTAADELPALELDLKDSAFSFGDDATGEITLPTDDELSKLLKGK